MTHKITLLLLAMACGRSKDNVQDTAEETIVEEVAILPTLTIVSPERASFTGEGDVNLIGEAVAGSAPLTTLTVGEDEATLDEHGAFSHPLELEGGLNIIASRLESEDGMRAVDGRAVYWGEVTQNGQTTENAIRMRIGPELIDDDDGELDDAASLIEMAMMDPSISELAEGNTVKGDYFDIVLQGLSFGAVDVDLWLTDGAIEGTIVITDLWLDFDVENILGTGSTSGSAWADTVTVELDVGLKMEDGELQTSMVHTETTFDGFGLTVDWFPDWLEDDLASWVLDTIEEETESTIEEQMDSLLISFLEGFMLDTEVGGLILSVNLNEVQIKDSGIRLTADVAIEGSVEIDLPTGAGSAQTDGDPPHWTEFPDAPLAVAIDDDLANQALLGLWTSGSLGGIELDGVVVQAMLGTTLNAPLGPVEMLRIDTLLPPMVRAPRDAEFLLDFGLGEMQISFEREDGIVHTFSVNAWSGSSIEIDEDGDVELLLDSRPSYVELEVGVLSWDEQLDPGDLAALIRLMVPPLLGKATVLAPSITIPTIPLGSLLGMESLEDLEFKLTEPEISLTENRWLFVSGNLETVQ